MQRAATLARTDQYDGDVPFVPALFLLASLQVLISGRTT